jgi:hypothetical protein
MLNKLNMHLKNLGEKEQIKPKVAKGKKVIKNLVQK